MAIEVEEIDVTGSSTHNVTLTYTPLSPTEVAVDPVGGPAQVYGVDFEVTGQVLNWDLPSSDIKQVVADNPTGYPNGDPIVLRVLYER
jgi:hypothetical protein